MSRLRKMHNNMMMVRGVLTSGDQGKVNAQLDKLINTVKIFYTSKQDFLDNFPDQDDINGKVRLIVRRRQ